MIEQTSWEIALKKAITQAEELFELLELPVAYLPAAKRAGELFPLKVPHSFVARMKKGDINDPLLRQVLPLHLEHDVVPGYSDDPLDEKKFNPLPGLLHKYHGRVLLTLVGSCAVNCRYCFRRHFPYAENNPGTAGWGKIFEYIANDSSIHEVILSGGDPLVAPDKLLMQFTQQLANISHVRRLRIHSRLPIVIPERVSPSFIEWIKSIPLQTVLVLHCNHPQEISESVRLKMQALKAAGVVLLNQAVLLKGVNDELSVLEALSEALFAAHIQPYYLHALDKVAGAAHFDMTSHQAKELHLALANRLSGFLVPKLVYETAFALSKLPL